MRTSTIRYSPIEITPTRHARRRWRQSPLVWVDRNGKVEPLPAPLRQYEAAALSPDGRHAAVSFTTARSESGTTILRAQRWCRSSAQKAAVRRRSGHRMDHALCTAAPEWAFEICSGALLTRPLRRSDSRPRKMRCRCRPPSRQTDAGWRLRRPASLPVTTSGCSASAATARSSRCWPTRHFPKKARASHQTGGGWRTSPMSPGATGSMSRPFPAQADDG
jgi:hypothetical protein